MIELFSGRVAHVSAPPLAPMERPIDLEHLSRMTLGERALEREVLQLFERQAGMLLPRMQQSCPANIAAAAHTLMGSARGIGAWSVARAAERVEAVAASEGPGVGDAVRALAACVDEARSVITDLLRAH
jgi:HPt (histidine-containing phosphotransfer) domain-containing protein